MARKLEFVNKQKCGFPLHRLLFMQSIVTNLAALAVAVLFYLWRAHYQTRRQHQRELRERVAYMLWIMAETIGDGNSGLTPA